MGPPFPPSPLPPWVRVSPRSPCFPQGPGPPCVRTSSPAARLLPSFHPCFPRTGGPGFTLYFPEVRARLSGFHASKCQGLVSGLPLYFPPCFQVTGDRCPQSGVRGLPDFQEARLSGARASALLPCFQEAMLPGAGGRGFHAFRPPGVGASALLLPPAFRSPAFMFSGGRASSMLSGGQGPDFPQASGSMLSGDRGPGPGLPALLFFLRSIFGLCLLY